MLIGAVGLLGLFPLLMVSPPVNMSLSSLSGTYEGDFGGGRNTFVLRPDGTYDQRFVTDTGRVDTNHGTWSPDTIQPGGVDFEHLLDTMDDSGALKPPKIIIFCGAAPHLMDDAIYFNEDDDIKILRTRG